PLRPYSLTAVTAPEPRPAQTPRPPRGRAENSSIEERLERLERMVESLMAREGGSQNPYPSKHLSLKDATIDRKDIAQAGAYAKRQADEARRQMVDPKEIEKIKEQAEKIKEQAKREAAHAAYQAKRATIEAEKAARNEPK